jgi:Helix-turn-helix domain
MAKVNVSQAAQMAGVSRSTIHKQLNSGKLSAERTDGRTLIDVSELERVFGTLVTPGIPKPNRRDLHSDTSQIAAILQSQIERLQRELDVTRQERQRDREEYRQERDRLLNIIENQTHLLPKPAEQEEKKGWLRRLFT